jgi:hypothetical protein
MLTLKENNNPIGTLQNGFETQNQLSERNKSIETVPPNRGLSERLMNAKIVRIHPGTVCACVKNYSKIIFYINTISRIDNLEPANEKETPLFYVEEELPCGCCCCGSCTPFSITFNIFDANTKELFSQSSINSLDRIVDQCCKDNYISYASIYNTKFSTGEVSTIDRHDSRSLYRTYEISGQSYYKFGEPYVEIETPCCESCSLYCFCSYIPCVKCIMWCCKCKPGCCTCNCQDIKEEVDKRRYIDILNMQDQPVGKFAYLFEKGVCCQKDKNFYEIYFPPDATEMVRLALIAQILYFFKFRATGNIAFHSLPGNRNNIEQFMS